MNRSRRYMIYAGLFALTMINYVDRINLSVAARPIAAQFHLSPVEMGYIFSSFLWTYILCLIPMGMAVDRWGARSVTAGSLALWSAAGALTGAVTTYAGLFATRLALGIGEPAIYPAGGRVVREWAPRSERGIATALLNSGAYAGPALGAVFVGWLVAAFDWRISFYVTGLVGVIGAALWYALYRRPEEASWLQPEERRKILAERDPPGAARQGSGTAARRAALKGLLRNRTMLALMATQGCAGYTLYLFMTWLPSYLGTSRGLDVLKSGLFSAIPYGVAVVLGLFLGWVSDRLLRGGGAQQGRRRNLIASVLLLSSVILAAPLVSSIWIILALISIALTCVSTAMAMNIALTNDLLKDGEHAGVAVSALILGGNLFGILAPIVTGYVVAGTAGFGGAFVIAGALLLIGATVSLTLTRSPIEVGAADRSAPAPACLPDVTTEIL